MPAADLVLFVPGAVTLFVAAALKASSGVPMTILPVLVLSLHLHPAVAVAVLTPAACLADWAVIGSCRAAIDGRLVRQALPFLVIGCGIGIMALERLDAAPLRLILAGLALLSVIMMLRARNDLRPSLRAPVALWGTLAGIGSAVGHAGGPLLAVWLLQKRLGRVAYVGTAVTLWACINHLALLAFILLGMLTPADAGPALGLAAAGWLGARCGLRLGRTVPAGSFRPFCVGMVIAASLGILASARLNP